jgi:uncharacterized protein YwgA
MKTQTEKFIAYLNLLDVKIDSDKFEYRIKAQKLAYIIQKLVGKTMYSDFSFYIRGPYSRELAKEYFDYKEDFVKGRSDSELTNEEKERIKQAMPLLKELSQRELEIVASLLYLKEKGFDENQAEIKLKELKPHLKPEEIWRGSNTIKKLFLTEKLRATIMSSFEKETEEWDSISNESLQKFK